MFAQQAALAAYSRAAVLFEDFRLSRRGGPDLRLPKSKLAAPAGGFYASMGMAEGQLGVDKRQYARETGQVIQGPRGLLRRDRQQGGAGAGGRGGRMGASASAPWPAGGFRHAEQDKGGPYLADTVEMGAALLALHRSTGVRKWLVMAMAAGNFVACHLRRSQDRRLLRLGFSRCQASAQADQAARGQCHDDALLHPARLIFRPSALSRDRRGRHG